MSKLLLAGLGAFGVLTLIVVVLFASGVSVYNDAARLKNTYEAKVDANRGELDNLKKKISQVAQVSDEQMKSLENIFVKHAEARSSKSENQLMTWIKESVPNVDQKTFINLQNVIVGSRDSWTMRQTELVDISREYNQRLVVFPGNVFLKLMGFEKIIPKVITSTSTEKAFATGKDDDTELFSRTNKAEK